MDAPAHDFKQARDYISRNGHTIQLIVLHATAGKNSLGWLLGNPRQTSIHILIDKEGHSTQLVKDEFGANHAGYSEVTLNGVHYGRAHGAVTPNAISLGIELENENNGKDPYPDAQLLEAARWVVYWRSLYGNIPMMFHYEIDTQGKSDPVTITHAGFQVFIDKVTGKKAKSCPTEDTSWTQFEPTETYTLNGTSNVRQGPGRMFGIATVYPATGIILFDGVKIGEMIGEDNRWFHVASGIGFIHASMIKFPKKEGTDV